MNIAEQMKIAANILLRLRCISSTSLLAGGAPRDWFLGNTARDLDFYIHSIMPAEGVIQGLMDVGLNVRTVGPPEQLYAGNHSSIRYVLEGEYCGMIFQIIVMDNAVSSKRIFDTFDMSICEITWGGLSHKSTAFLKTIRTKIIICKEERDLHTPHGRKMRRRFPRYNFEVKGAAPAKNNAVEKKEII